MMAVDGSHLERRLKNMVPKRKEEKKEESVLERAQKYSSATDAARGISGWCASAEPDYNIRGGFVGEYGGAGGW